MNRIKIFFAAASLRRVVVLPLVGSAFVAVMPLVAAAVLFFAAGCTRGVDMPTADEAYGTLDLGAVSYGLAETRAVDTSGYVVKIWRIRSWGEEPVTGTPSTVGEFAQPVVLPVARYRLEVASSAEPQAAAFDSPWYVGGTEFSITRDNETRPAVVCTLQNAQVTVRYAEGLQDTFWEPGSVKTVVTVGGRSLEFPYGEIRKGYFAVEGSAEMSVVFTGKVSGNETSIERTLTLRRGEWHRLRFKLEDDSSFPIIVLDEGDNGAGQIDDGTPWN